MAVVLFASRYNFAVADSGAPDAAVALFNAATGALQRLTGRDARALADYLCDPSGPLDEDALGPALIGALRRGGFLREEGADEVAEIRDRFWRARGETPVVITLTTTMECNLGCYYCYEERSGASLSSADVPSIVAFARERVANRAARTLHVDWYGGEPLLNRPFVEAASQALQDMCSQAGVEYAASVITNGTEWPEDVEAFVARHRIRQVQVSFDGLQRNHDRRRRFRRPGAEGAADGRPASSFERAVALVDRLVACVRVDLRFNIDRGNQDDLIPFVRFARARGWFDAAYPAVFQPARLAAYSGASAFMRSSQLSLEAFDALRASVRRELAGRARIEESEAPDGYPYPKTSVCAALADRSAVVGADGLVYRCGLQVGEAGRAVDTAGADRPGGSDAVGQDHAWWRTFDPTRLPSCSACSFLPVCWGGCPKKHLEREEDAIREQGAYWRTNLPRLIASAAGFDDHTPAVFSDADQFRPDGVRPSGQLTF